MVCGLDVVEYGEFAHDGSLAFLVESYDALGLAVELVMFVCQPDVSEHDEVEVFVRDPF